MGIFYEVATLTEPQDGNFYAVLEIDTDKRAGGGCVATVMALHTTFPEADAEALRHRAAKENEGYG